MKRQRGVSLTEMLVCLVIIAILVGLLSPVFSKTKANAKQVGDVSNMRQIYAALQLYKADNDGYPLASTLRVSLASYLGGAQLNCTSGVKARSDYHILAFPDFFLQDDPAFVKDLEACRESRAGQLPLVQDDNHFDSVENYRTGEAYLLLLRENGAYERLTATTLRGRLDPSKINSWPCPLRGRPVLDWNY
jgi:prepilin-type N-terminal cleavage/methylation domain-containing protein